MKKRYQTILATLLCGTLVLAGFTGCASADTDTGSAEISASAVSAEDSAQQDVLTAAAESLLKSHGSTEGKEETVYVIADANGSPTETIVSSWLKNPDENDTITDKSDLQNIENVKGDQTYTEDENGDIVWQADGSDIYYQGTTDEALPVDTSIAYELDGKEVSPEELDGASGHLTMTFRYTNNTAAEREVDGETVTMYQPFMVVSGTLFDNEKVSDIEVTNGKAVNTGDQTAVVGYALPGLAESLGLADMTDADGNPVEIDVPESVTIDADVTDFSLMATITVIDDSMLQNIDLDDEDALDELADSMDELTDASTQLKDGASDLYDAISGDLADGVDSLNEGAEELDDGLGQIADGAEELDNGAAQLDEGAGTLKDGTASLSEGAGKVYAGMVALDTGIGTLKAGVAGLPESTQQLLNGSKLIYGALKTNSTSNPGVYEGVASVSTGATTIAAGAQTLYAGENQITTASASIASGASTLYTSITSPEGQLQQGLTSISTGAATIQTNIGAYLYSSDTSVYKIAGGIAQYADGISEGVSTAAGTISSAAGIASDAAAAAGEVSGAISAAGSDVSSAYAVLSSIDTSSMDPAAAAAIQSAMASLGDASAQLSATGTQAATLGTDAAYLSAYSSGLADAGTQLSTATSTITSYAGNIQTIAQTIGSSGSDTMTGLESISSGAAQISTQLTSAANTYIKSGSTSSSGYGIYEAAVAINQGSKQISAGLVSGDASNPGIYEGAAAIGTGCTTLMSGISTILSDSNMGALISGLNTLNAGSSTIVSGIDQLAEGSSQLVSGTASLAEGASTLDSGAQSLKEGTSSLVSGTASLKTGADSAKDGSSQLADGTASLAEGVSDLEDGAEELSDGMAEFDEDGIQKLTSFLKDNGEPLIDRLKELQAYSKEYTSFSGTADSSTSSVRFIIRTDAIGDES